ncbi:MAG: tRNA (adenosine(37)-N6)-threonylcarbamoyltransferase complex ATPase subunit type 1 TsaE [Rhodobacteraceae bacterium]|nr:tRNA (adenosine(37)-N6)-threonylcarbamoyltransferase complex ATPase subunit type 1 TsaE [Paracoccaceae bacterium]
MLTGGGYHHEFRFGSAQETAAFAAGLAPLLRAGDTILLQGGLGAGKTHFARSLIQAWLARAGLAEDVPSPTFTLVQTYCDGEAEIWHADLYRLTGPDEVTELGLEEAFGAAICLIEWPDRLKDLTPEGALTLRFAMTSVPGERMAVATSADRRWADVLAKGLGDV